MTNLVDLQENVRCLALEIGQQQDASVAELEAHITAHSERLCFLLSKERIAQLAQYLFEQKKTEADVENIALQISYAMECSQSPRYVLCPPHTELAEVGKLDPIEQCVVCMCNQRDELQRRMEQIYNLSRTVPPQGIPEGESR